MVAVNVLEQKAATAEVNPKIAEEIADIVEESERTEHTNRTDTPHLFYSVPFAGVRYYYLEDTRTR